MRVVVDFDTCQCHGQCMIAAPDVFRVEGEFLNVLIEQPPEALRADVEEAVDACPTQSIRIEE